MRFKNVEANIWKYYLVEILSGFWFILPIMILYLLSFDLTYTQIGILEFVCAITVILLEIPTGVFADFVGRKWALFFGCVFWAVTFFVIGLSNSFLMFLLGFIFWGIGDAFLSGTTSALLYDTLKALKKEKEFLRFKGRAMFLGSIALMIGSIFGGVGESIGRAIGGVVGSDVYYNGVVYVVSQKGMIYGFDSDGKKVFEKKIANSIMSSPVVCKGILYVVSTDGYLYAVSLREEKVLWRVYTGSLIYGAKPVVINGDGIYVASSKGQLVKVAFDGRKIWVFGVEGSIVGETPAYHNGKIFFGTEDNRVYAVDTKTGREIWLQKVKARIVASSPLIVRGKLYIGDFAGYIYAMRLKDGKIVWKKQLNGKIVSSPVSYKNNIIVGTTKGIVYAMKLDDGSLIWKRELATRIEVSPKVWKGKLVVPAGNLLYVLSLKTGNIFWKHKIKTKITTSPMIMKTGDNEIIFIGDADGNLYALNSMLKIKKTKSF
jgi:outer membrane protein assembly factor BamB